MTRRFWIPATALCLSAVMAMTGSVSRDAVAGIVAVSHATAASVVGEEGQARLRSVPEIAPRPPWNDSARYRMRVIVLLIVILLVLWLIYRTFTGWKPMIS